MDTVLNHTHTLPNHRSILCKIQLNVTFPQFFRYSRRIFSTQRYGSQSQIFKSSAMLRRVDWWINTIILNTCQSTRRNDPKYLDFHQHLRQNFKFLIVLKSQLCSQIIKRAVLLFSCHELATYLSQRTVQKDRSTFLSLACLNVFICFFFSGAIAHLGPRWIHFLGFQITQLDTHTHKHTHTQTQSHTHLQTHSLRCSLIGC